MIAWAVTACLMAAAVYTYVSLWRWTKRLEQEIDELAADVEARRYRGAAFDKAHYALMAHLGRCHDLNVDPTQHPHTHRLWAAISATVQ